MEFPLEWIDLADYVDELVEVPEEHLISPHILPRVYAS